MPDRNRADGNIQQPITSELSNTETVMGYNKDIDPPPPQDISNVFAAADLSSQSSYYTVKYKRAWHRAKGIRSSILSSGESPGGGGVSISSLYSGSFDRNRADGNIQQPTTPEVDNTETVMAYNEDLDPPPPQDISNVFAAADLLSQS